MGYKRKRGLSVSGGFLSNALRGAGAAYNLYRSSHKKAKKSHASGAGSSTRSGKGGRGHSGHSKTMTKHRSKSLHTVEAVHGEIKRNFKKLIVGRRVSSKQLRRDGWMLLQTYNVPLTTMVSAEGTQNPSYVQSFASLDQIVTSSGTPDLRYQMASSLFDSNPTQSTIGGTLFTSIVAPADDRIILNRIKLTFEFSNQTSAPTLFDVYIVKQKVNGSVDPVTEWQNVLTSRNFGKAITNFPNTATAQPGGYNRNIIVGTRPDNLPGWRKMFKILCHKEYELAPNANVNETYFLHYGKLLDKKYIVDTLAGGDKYLGGTTVHLMCIQRGAIGVDISTGVNKPASTACILPTQIAAITAAEYECRVVKQSRVKAEYVNPMQFYSGSALANEKIINVVDATAALLVNN